MSIDLDEMLADAGQDENSNALCPEEIITDNFQDGKGSTEDPYIICSVDQ